MSSQPEPTARELHRRLFNIPASRPTVRYSEALQSIGTRGQRHETRVHYLDRAVLEGQAILVFTHDSGAIFAWLDAEGKHEITETHDVYLAISGVVTRDRKRVDPRGGGEYYLPIEVKGDFLSSLETEIAAVKADRAEKHRQHVEGKGGEYERRIRAALGLHPNDHMVTVYDRTGERGFAGFSFTLYLSPAHAEALVAAVEDHTDKFTGES